MTAQSTTILSLAEVAAAQQKRKLFAFDRGQYGRDLARLQRIYASKLAQLEAFHFFFDEGQPDIILRSADQKLALRLPGACDQVSEIYSGLRDALSEELRGLEEQIVRAHQQVAQEQYEDQHFKRPDEEPDYLAAIRALCEPAAPLVVSLPTPPVPPAPRPAQLAQAA